MDIIGMIQAGFIFGAKLLDYLQTEDGKAFVKKATEDRATWDKFWSDAASGLTGFFKGMKGL